MKKSIRFDKYCSQLGIFSRRTIKNVIKCQEIFCNDIKIQKPDQKIFYGDILRFGEQTIEVTDDVVILLNKPV
jgi:16S rRNA U516 pseudouridylate synthase RsuA-like enzyme